MVSAVRYGDIVIQSPKSIFLTYSKCHVRNAWFQECSYHVFVNMTDWSSMQRIFTKRYYYNIIHVFIYSIYVDAHFKNIKEKQICPSRCNDHMLTVLWFHFFSVKSHLYHHLNWEILKCFQKADQEESVCVGGKSSLLWHNILLSLSFIKNSHSKLYLHSL